MKSFIFPAISVVLILSACQNAEEESPVNISSEASASPVANGVLKDTQAAVKVVPTPPATPPIVLNPAPSPVATSASGVNPPHGQPGHRCDIAVGAPLPQGGKPATTVTPPPPQIQLPPQTAPIPISAAPSTNPASAGVGKKVNPPHGQPGHRCDIAVGAPLN